MTSETKWDLALIAGALVVVLVVVFAARACNPFG